MCGIFGVIWHGSADVPDEHRLQRTARLLRHRGPDDTGIYAGRGIGLVQTRLSLLDLSPRSNQPFWDKQRRYCLVYNGEIYNFKELRVEMEQQGIQFTTTSDTEVLLEGLINFGVEATLPKLEGMYAFALYDDLEKSFTLARDPFGIKPLFIYNGDDAFIFTSEIRAMESWIQFKPDLLSISAFLFGFSGPTKGCTFFENVKFLDPGCVVKICQGKPAKFSRFFSLGEFWDRKEAEDLQQLKPEQLVDKVDELLNQSVRSQLFADAPVGALCSGGIDSSIIMALASRYHNNLAIFHANVVGPLSEYGAALQLAKHLKLDLKTVAIQDKDFIDQIPEVIEHYGHPFYPCPHSIPFFMVSKLVRSNNVKAVLSGEGADECFLGYDYLAPNLRKWRNPRTIRELLRSMRGRATSASKFTFWGPSYIRGGDGNTQSGLIMALHNRFEVVEEALELRNFVQTVNGDKENKSALQSLDLLNYNLRSLLHRNDSMGMAASIESRFPYLDTNLVKLAINLPYNCKIRFSPTVLDKSHYFFRDKWILRKVGDRYLPRELSQREKKPFPVNAYSSECMHINPAFFQKSFIADLFGLSENETQYLIDNANHDLKWKMLQLDVWAHVCLNKLPKESSLCKLRNYLSVRSVESLSRKRALTT